MNTVKFKSKKFAVRIVNLYKFLCNDNCAAEQASVQTLRKVNVPSAKKIFCLKFTLLSKKQMKHSIG